MTKNEAIARIVDHMIVHEMNEPRAIHISEALNMAIKALKQKSEIGHWTEHPHEWGENWEYSQYECSVCHGWAYFDTDFCPNCGIEMESEE